MTKEIRRLYRSRNEGRLAGVCAGLGRYFYVDPVVVRLMWIAVTFITGFIPGILAYLVAWLIVPEEPVIKTSAAPEPQAYESGA